MSLLERVKKKHIPILSLLLSAALIVCFVMVEKQDESRLQQVISLYKQQSLLKIEKPIYIDFIERRLNIEQLGSESYLKQLHQAAKLKNPDHFITLLLKDRFFYPYLFEEWRLFMSASEFRTWQTKREETIHPILTQLNERNFALSFDHKRISNLITYVVIEPFRLWLILNISILLVCGAFLEFRLGKAKVVLLFFTSTFTCGSLYLIVSNQYSDVLQGLSGTLLALMGACLVQIYLIYRKGTSFKVYFALTLLSILIIIAYLTALVVWQHIDISRLSVLLVMLVVGGIFSAILWQLESLIQQTKPERNQVLVASPDHDQCKIENEYRADLAQVMDLISSFSFDKARAQLTLLSQLYPDAADLMEQRYHIEKLYPNEKPYWACTRELVNFSVAHNNYALMKTVFSDIQKNASSKQQAKQRLEPEYYHKMMAVFIAHDDLNRAEKAFLFLELAGQKDIIKEACQLLIQEFKARGTRVKQQQYQMLFERIAF